MDNIAKKLEIPTLFWYHKDMKRIDVSAMERQELEQFAVATAQENTELKLQVKQYEEQLKLARHKQFAAKSEQTPATPGEEQLSLFNEAEALAEEEKPEPKSEQVHPPRKKKKKGTKDALGKDLPKTVVEYDLTAEEKVCPICGEALHEMKKRIRKTFEIIPAQVRVKEEVQFVYSCRHCEKHGIEVPIVAAPMPATLFRNSVSSPSLLSYIIVRKYGQRAPLHQIVEEFRAAQLRLSRQTLSNWVIQGAQQYVEPLYLRLQEWLKKEPIIHADETTVQVLQEPGKTASSKSYMWVYRTGKDAEHPVVLYEYTPSRSGAYPKAYLQEFDGYLQTDGYDGYNAVEGATRVGCFAHVRRKFVEAQRGLPKEVDVSQSAAYRGQVLCDELFALDEQVKRLHTKEERDAYKDTVVRPKLDAFFAWVDTTMQSEWMGGLLGKALSYAKNESSYLRQYLLDGNLELSNNLAEQSIRPFVMGRKNWLFCNAPDGAQASAAWYSLVETAKANGLQLFEYFTYLLDCMRQAPRMDDAVIDSLLPWSPQLPERCRLPQESSDS